MRSPFHKVYREFPQLDRFDDKTCRKIASRAYRFRRFSKWAFRDVAIFVLMPLGFWLVMMLGWYGLAVILKATLPIVIRSSWFDQLFYVVVGWWGVAYLGWALILCYSVQWLQRRDLRRYLGNSSCRKCGYALLALPPVENTDPQQVACPECGTEQQAPQEIDLSQFG